MRNNSLLIRTAVMALCAAGLMACSAKVESGSKGGEPPSPPYKTSDQNQSLKVTNETHSEDLANELLLVNPSEVMSFYFEYKAERSEKLYFRPGMMVGLNCETGKIDETYTWLQIAEDQVIKETPILYAGDNVLVKPGQMFRLKVTFTGLSGCEQMSSSFYVSSVPVNDVMVGEGQLVVGQAYTIQTDKREASMFYDLYFSSAQAKDMYFTYVSSQATDDCGEDYSQSMEWLTLDGQGNIAHTQALTNISDFSSIANTDHILRVWFKNAATCSYMNVGFQVSFD